ncbi:sigma factor-like helix-turn-helix DNA-binding protein [Tsukamurella pulmonis]|uniref:sigma factor-like helix-turn-helix DNA-binding protein n=2 Tax=Tsukamurella pulmonis TaxID=47312 RepID=UPI0010587E20|nr:sigma factor-like helix-turn-helix DNA-binding protein [Tsukamurella pulmonis]
MGHGMHAVDARMRAVLPPELYRVLRLRLIERRTVEDTARLLRITPQAVRVRQHRALERIRGAHEVFALRDSGRSALS